MRHVKYLVFLVFVLLSKSSISNSQEYNEFNCSIVTDKGYLLNSSTFHEKLYKDGQFIKRGCNTTNLLICLSDKNRMMCSLSFNTNGFAKVVKQLEYDNSFYFLILFSSNLKSDTGISLISESGWSMALFKTDESLNLKSQIVVSQKQYYYNAADFCIIDNSIFISYAFNENLIISKCNCNLDYLDQIVVSEKFGHIQFVKEYPDYCFIATFDGVNSNISKIDNLNGKLVFSKNIPKASILNLEFIFEDLYIVSNTLDKSSSLFQLDEFGDLHELNKFQNCVISSKFYKYGNKVFLYGYFDGFIKINKFFIKQTSTNNSFCFDIDLNRLCVGNSLDLDRQNLSFFNIFKDKIITVESDLNLKSGDINYIGYRIKEVTDVKTTQYGISNQFNGNEIVLYPNPANNNLIVQNLPNSKLEIFDLLGKIQNEIYVERIDLLLGITVVNISNLVCGEYILKCGEMKSHFIKE